MAPGTPVRACRAAASLRVVRFGFASGVGFLVTEAILLLGVAVSYHSIQVPHFDYSSPGFLGLDALAFGCGVTVAFMINERVTVERKNQSEPVERTRWLVRWGKYQLASLLGSVVIVAVQLVLLAMVSLSPVFGNVVGAIVSYPLTFLISMRFVWGSSTSISAPGY